MERISIRVSKRVVATHAGGVPPRTTARTLGRVWSARFRLANDGDWSAAAHDVAGALLADTLISLFTRR